MSKLGLGKTGSILAPKAENKWGLGKTNLITPPVSPVEEKVETPVKTPAKTPSVIKKLINPIKESAKIIGGIAKGLFVDYPIDLVKDVMAVLDATGGNVSKAMLTGKLPTVSDIWQPIANRLQERGLGTVKLVNHFYANPLTDEEVEKYTDAKPVGVATGILDWLFVVGLVKSAVSPVVKQVPLVKKAGVEIEVSPKGVARKVAKVRTIDEIKIKPTPQNYKLLTGKTGKPPEAITKFFQIGNNKNHIIKVSADTRGITMQAFNVEPSALDKALTKIFKI